MGSTTNNLKQQAQINGFEIVSEYDNGISGAVVLKVKKNNQFFIYKSHSEKTTRERNGYRILSKTIYQKHLPKLVEEYSLEDKLMYPYCEGESLRTIVKQKLMSSDDILDCYKYCLNFLLDTWKQKNHEKTKVDNIPVRSIQREEWNETIKLLDIFLDRISVDLKISKETFVKTNILVNKQDCGTLSDSLNLIKNLITNLVPDERKILAHGDLTTNNVVVDYQSEVNSSIADKIMFIDYEWTGTHDFAEVFAKTARVKIAHSSPNPVNAKIKLTNSVQIEIETDDLSLPSITSVMQQYAIESLYKLETELKISDFRKYVIIYMAGFYLRDVVLAYRRGGRPDEIFAMANLMELLTLLK